MALANNIRQKARVIAFVSGRMRTTHAEELTERSATVSNKNLLFNINGLTILLN